MPARTQWTTRTGRLLAALCAVAAAAGLWGCGVDEPLKIGRVQVGRSLNSDNTVGIHTTSFKPDDTIYVSVLNDGPGRGEIVVRWWYSGQPLGETRKQVSYRSSSATEFHFRNSGGFPVGPYKVEILVDGRPAATREFRVG